MISNKSIALKINEKSLKIGNELNDLILIAQDNCSSDELLQLKIAVGRVMGELLLEIMNPIYKKHPELKPKNLL